jgi:hypothetical protein
MKDTKSALKLATGVMLFGFTAMLAVVGYFNITLNHSILELHQLVGNSDKAMIISVNNLHTELASIDVALDKKINENEIMFAILKTQTDAFSNLCCGEMDDVKLNQAYKDAADKEAKDSGK